MTQFCVNNHNSNLGAMYEKLTDRETRKARGIFYTPNFIVEYILKYTVLEVDVVKNPFVKILDPACGAGYFLDKAYDILKEKFESNLEGLRQNYRYTLYYKELYEGYQHSKVQELRGHEYWTKENIHYHILKHCLYGADLDAVAVTLTKNTLLNKSSKKIPGDINIVCCNSLLKWEEANIEKEYERLKEILEYEYLNYSNKVRYDINKLIFSLKEFWSNEFDYIIGNPPYVVLLESETEKLYWQYITSKYNTIGYKKNLFYLLIERSLEKLRLDGKHSFIIPDRFFLANSYIKSRKNLFNNSKVISITQFSNKVFEDAIVGTAVYIVQNCIYEDKHKINLKLNYKSEQNCQYTHVYQGNIVKEKNSIINIVTNSEYIGIIEKIKNNSKLLMDFSNIHVGMMVKNKEQSLRTYQNNEDNRIVIGRDLGEYIIENEERYCCLKNIEVFGGTKNINKHLIYPKIFLRKTGNRIVASLDDKGIVAEQSVYLIIPSNKKDIYNILGQIQSKLSNFYFKEALITNPEAYPYIQHYDVERLPINPKVIIDQHFQQLIFKIVDLKNKIKTIKFQCLIEDSSSYINIVDSYRKIKNKQLNLKSKLIKYVNESNYILYKAYNLTEEEIRLLEYRIGEDKKDTGGFYFELVEEIYKILINQCIKLLEEKGKYLYIEEIKLLLQQRLKNYNDFIKVIRNYDKNIKSPFILEEILNLYSYRWSKYAKNKASYMKDKKLIKYSNKYYGLSSWTEEIHNIWFQENKTH